MIFPFKLLATIFFMAWRSGCGACSNTSCCLRTCLFCFSVSCNYLRSISLCVPLSTSKSVFEVAFCLSCLESCFFYFLLFRFCFSCWFLSSPPPLATSLLMSLCLCIAPSRHFYLMLLCVFLSRPLTLSLCLLPSIPMCICMGSRIHAAEGMCRSKVHSAATGLRHNSTWAKQAGVQAGRQNV